MPYNFNINVSMVYPDGWETLDPATVSSNEDLEVPYVQAQILNADGTPSEDPDLISGKFQPGKALNEIEAIWNPSASLRNKRPNFVPAGVKFSNEGYNADAVVQSGKYSTTHSPATRMARALLYLSPFAPKPYDIDVTVPYTGRIGNR